MNDLTTTGQSGALALQEAELVQVLQSSLYPGASMPSIKMVLGYCKAAGLDPMQKPVHIVPMWDAKAGQMRDVVMPGVNLYRTQAARSGAFAGMSEPEFGPLVTDTIGGVQITYPEWCRVTVERVLAGGVIAKFTAVEYWIENYAVKGGKERSIAPNAMWIKRPRGQIAKCASAQALRIAFPEIASQPTADEMEGAVIDAEYSAPAPEQTKAGPQRKSAQTQPDAAAPAQPSQARDDRPEPESETDTRTTDAPAPTKPAAPVTTAPAGAINGGQVKYLRAKMAAAGVEEASIVERFELPDLEHMNVQQFDEIKSELLAMT